MRNWLLLAVVVAVAAAAAIVTGHSRDTSTATPASASEASSTLPATTPSSRPAARGREAFVGSAACAACHRAQGDAYFGSHHAKALVTPSAEMAKVRFDGSHFTSKLGGSTKFALQDGRPVVSTPIPGGKNARFPIAYISGVWPLEQFVVATERGKLQSLGAVWDSRAASEGGNKWFHVYGPSGIAPSDPLFFTSPAQNWNHVCADCHSTLVERRYDLAADRFDTRWQELAVGCEACHGPGAEHVRSAKAGPAEALVHLPVRLKLAEPWLPSATGSPTPRSQEGVEVEVCAPCHSRRKPLKEGFVASDAFLDSFEPELLRPGSYHADGQVEGEVYEWGSFVQSRMFHAGVRCSDCHDAHSGKLHAQGNALCVRCHDPSHFDVASHSHHTGARAPRCIDCHMPPGTFMQIDERRDHSIRIPRPDRSVELGTPNACNLCHAKQSATWARAAVADWFPASQKRTHLLDAIGQDRKGELKAPSALRTLALNLAAPAITRASALERLGQYPGERTRQTLQQALASAEPLMVYGAVRGAAELPPSERLSLLLPALTHKLRAVRVAAGRALAGVRLTELPPSARAALEHAFTEVQQSFDVGASRADTQVEQSAFQLARGDLAAAEASIKSALRLQPCLAEAYLNLADLERQRHDEAAAERALRAALACAPKNAAAHHALGLWQVRAGQSEAALASFRQAVELAPTNPRFSYVLAVALAGKGDRAAAISRLDETLKQHPNDRAALQALAGYLREAGQVERAADARQKLEVLLGQ